eukprot:15430234-Alexandrium_andersonii.AAC.1
MLFRAVVVSSREFRALHRDELALPCSRNRRALADLNIRAWHRWRRASCSVSCTWIHDTRGTNRLCAVLRTA